MEVEINCRGVEGRKTPFFWVERCQRRPPEL